MNNENQEGKQKRPARPQIQAYSTAEQAEAFINHPLLAKCVISQDKSAIIIAALDFMHKWKDRVAEIESGKVEPDQSRIAELEQKVKDMESAAADRDGQITTLQEKVVSLETLNEELQAENDRVVSESADSSEQAQTIEQLQNQIAELQAAAQSGVEVTWEQIAATIDPVYARMAEEAARMHSTNEDEVTPLRALVDIFAKYHIFRYTELPFQRFISEKKLEEIVNQNYPEMGGLRGLRKALQ